MLSRTQLITRSRRRSRRWLIRLPCWILRMGSFNEKSVFNLGPWLSFLVLFTAFNHITSSSTGPKFMMLIRVPDAVWASSDDHA